jgi:hypothetical protein
MACAFFISFAMPWGFMCLGCDEHKWFYQLSTPFWYIAADIRTLFFKVTYWLSLPCMWHDQGVYLHEPF